MNIYGITCCNEDSERYGWLIMHDDSCELYEEK